MVTITFKKILLCVCSVLLISALLMSACTCTACGAGSELAGKWTSTSSIGTHLSFSSTGKVVMSGDGVTLSGTYTADGSTLKMTLTAPNDTVLEIEAKYEVQDNRLSLTNELGYVEVFTK